MSEKLKSLTMERRLAAQRLAKLSGTILAPQTSEIPKQSRPKKRRETETAIAITVSPA